MNLTSLPKSLMWRDKIMTIEQEIKNDKEVIKFLLKWAKDKEGGFSDECEYLWIVDYKVNEFFSELYKKFSFQFDDTQWETLWYNGLGIQTKDLLQNLCYGVSIENLREEYEKRMG